MGHIPNAKNGLHALTCGNESILMRIAVQSDIAMARQEEDRDASLKAIKKRHQNELKAAKRNHKHRAKKIKDRMAEFENMDSITLADRFRDGLQDHLFEVGFTAEIGWLTTEKKALMMQCRLHRKSMFQNCVIPQYTDELIIANANDGSIGLETIA